jgi:predicted phage tail component-like protein
MITFNNFNLNDRINYIVTSIDKGRGSAERGIDYGYVSTREGIKILSEEYRERRIEIRGIVFADTVDNFRTAVDNMKEELSESSAHLIIDETNRYYVATPSVVEISDMGGEITSADFSVSFIAELPFALGSELTTNYTSISGTTTTAGYVSISGTAYARPTLTYYIPDGDGLGFTTLSGITITHTESGNFVTWSGSNPLTYSGTAIFNYNTNSVVIRGTEDDFSGLFNVWNPGDNNFNVTYSGLSVGGSWKLSYNPRYV